MKKIKKVAVTEIPEINGSIVDGTNIDDKTTNTYSANIIDGLVNGEEYLISNTLFTKINNYVFVTMCNSQISEASAMTTTLPEKFRPKRSISIPGVYTTAGWAGMVGRVDIAPSGAVTVRKIKTGDYGETENTTSGYIAINGFYPLT